MSVSFLLMKKLCSDRDGYNIVKGMCSGCNSKTPKGEQSRKINTCDGPENKLRYIKRIDGIGLTAEKVNMVVRAKQSRGNKDREHDGIRLGEL